MVAIRNRAGLSRQEIVALAVELEVLESPPTSFDGAGLSPLALSVRPSFIDVVIQDEFTHDARVPWRGRALVFGST